MDCHLRSRESIRYSSPEAGPVSPGATAAMPLTMIHGVPGTATRSSGLRMPQTKFTLPCAVHGAAGPTGAASAASALVAASVMDRQATSRNASVFMRIPRIV